MGYKITTTAAIAEIRTPSGVTAATLGGSDGIIKSSDPHALRQLADDLYDAASELEGFAGSSLDFD